MVSTSTSPKKSGIPDGEYRLVGWDLDTTGQRLIDEICQIAAYTPTDSFSQYVMPYKDLNIKSKRQYMICTVTVGYYRMLKDTKTGKVIKTKSEISALVEFISWLEKIHNQEKACTGIILLCHEKYELAPLILLEALRRYNLIERFSNVVKGFANCFAFVKQKCEQSVRSFSLRVLSKILLDRENENTNSAVDRARLAYQLVHHLCQGMGENTGAGDATVSSKVIMEALSEFTSTIADEEKAIEGFKLVLQRQNTLKPVFGPLMRRTVSERRHAISLRRLLTEALFDYDTLKKAWEDGSKDKEAFSSLLNDKLSKASDKQRQELLTLLINHFDPSKPMPTREINQVNKRNSNEKRSTGEQSSTPETTPTAESSPSKSNGTVTPLDESPKHVNGNSNQTTAAK
ncbi:maternal protein exuperantia [Lycorma delicatula]|uniref:maternal protein exuperantia n=1 Tax=Lycorma delicatula TaxID=130591 RepID=UPI003F511715